MGHPRFLKNIYLWLIDKDWNIYIEKATESIKHSDWDTYITKIEGFIAYGRYDKNSEKVSLILNLETVDGELKSINEMGYIRKQVIKILDKEFDNPTIFEF